MDLPRRAAQSPWVRTIGLGVAVVVAALSLEHIPRASALPAALGLIPFILGKYLVAPLRWRQISAAGKPVRWHVRVQAEAELLGLLVPGRAAADLWRAHELHKTGLERPAAWAEIGLDRLVGAAGLTVFVLATGAALPMRVMLAGLGVGLLVLVTAFVLARRRPALLAQRPRPSRMRLVRGVLLAVAYQLSFAGLLVGTTDAVGHPVPALALLGVFGASQVAGLVPGVHGAGPREGALVVGLVSLGVPWASALGAISLTAVLAWVPALLIGGTCMLARRFRRVVPHLA
ncbi:MAG: glycosyltransferase 2 family protein [Frankiaceae bacterium]|nr:glycosyltransferase 2 family protein [Frankiaceae bacterium]MDX6273324.1 glycosyltransferase 2 family protein [Frankiales bacterium]